MKNGMVHNQFHKVMFVTLLGLLMFCCGCSLSRNGIKVLSEKEIQKYATDNFGACELVSSEYDEDKNVRTCLLTDKTYGFTYYVSSEPQSVGLDGSVFGYSGVINMTNRTEKMYEYVSSLISYNLSLAGIELVKDLDYSPYATGRKFSVKNGVLLSDDEHWEKDLEAVRRQLKNYNACHDFDTYRLRIYSPDKSYGEAGLETFKSSEESSREFWLSRVYDLCGISDFEYVRTEKIPFEQVPGLAEQNLYPGSMLGPGKDVTVYYFTYEGKEYFITNAEVIQYDLETNAAAIQAYQNYKTYGICED